jgi:hypothetical protein
MFPTFRTLAAAAVSALALSAVAVTSASATEPSSPKRMPADSVLAKAVQGTITSGLVNGWGLCLSVDNGGSTADGTPIIQYTCNNSPSQAWWPYSDGTIRNGYGKCLALPGASTKEGAQLIEYTCNGNLDQEWAGYGDGSIQNLNSGYYISVGNGDSTALKTPIVQWSYNGDNGQTWGFVG